MRNEGKDNANATGTSGSRALPNHSAIVLPIALFGLYTFVLMSTGTQGDNALAGREADVALYNLREGLLLVGFLMHGVFSWKRPRTFTSRAAKGACAVLAALYALCAAVMVVAPLDALIVVSVMTMSLLVGLAGGAVYERVAFCVSRDLLVGSSTPAARVAGLAALNGSSACPSPLNEESERAARSVMSDEQAAYSATSPASSSVEGKSLSHDVSIRMLGVVVGIGGALAVIAQYLLQLEFSLGGWFVALLAVAFCFLMYLMGKAKNGLASCSADASGGFANAFVGASAGASAGVSSGLVARRRVLYLVAVVACLFALFSFYEPVIRDAFTWVVFYQWHRLFLIAGYLVIGAAAFFGGRPAASLTVAIAALFTAFILTQTALLQVDNFTMAMFYALLGAVIAYSGISFMSLAPHTERPSFVASAGRVLECAVTIAGGIAASSLDEWPVSAVLFASLVLIALTIALMVRGGFFTHQAIADSKKAGQQVEGEAALDVDASLGVEGSATGAEVQLVAMGESPSVEEERPKPDGPDVAPIAERYGLTRRETEVLGLVLRDLTVQQMADELVVTKSTVKFHVTNILKKTDSENRQQLLEKLSNE